MITNEAEIRIALQAVLIAVLVLYGCWGCALMVLLILLPWKPIFAVGSYLAEPLADWRTQKASHRHAKGMAQIERELDALLEASNAGGRNPALHAAHDAAGVAAKAAPVGSVRSIAPVIQRGGAGPAFKRTAGAQDPSAHSAIPPAIKDHLRNLPQGVLNNMDLEIEEIEFHGDMAQASVRFRSPNVSELIIRQRYVLRKSGDHWQVESRQPADAVDNRPPLPAMPERAPMQFS
jgi:hypothetical protein